MDIKNLELKNTEWKALSDLLGEDLSTGVTYYINNNRSVPFWYIETTDIPDEEAEGTLNKARQLIYKVASSTLYVRMSPDHKTVIDVDQVEE